MKTERRLPEAIRLLVEGKTYETDEIGMSSATVQIYEDMVLKIQDRPEELEKEYCFMKWLEHTGIVPKALAFEALDGWYFLLMSRMPGQMSCAKTYMENPQILIKILAEGLKTLWQIGPKDCPVQNTLEVKLKQAAENIKNGWVDVEDAEPDTYGEGGFRDPEDLLDWLCANRPEEELTLTHGDYCLPNVFGEGDAFRGLIDLGRMGVADKWQDIALCYRSLCHNADGTYGVVYENVKPELLFEALGLEPDWEKIRYYILLDELF